MKKNVEKFENEIEKIRYVTNIANVAMDIASNVKEIRKEALEDSNNVLSKESIIKIEKAICRGMISYSSDSGDFMEYIKQLLPKIKSDIIKMDYKKSYKILIGKEDKPEKIVVDYYCQQALDKAERDIEKYTQKIINELLENKEIVQKANVEFINSMAFAAGVTIGAIAIRLLILL